MEVCSLSHWTTREVPPHSILNECGHQVLLLTLPTLQLENKVVGDGDSVKRACAPTHTHIHSLSLSLLKQCCGLWKSAQKWCSFPPTPSQYIFSCAEILMNELQVANLDSQLTESPPGTTVPLQRAMTCQLFAFLEKLQLENPFNYHGR